MIQDVDEPHKGTTINRNDNVKQKRKIIMQRWKRNVQQTKYHWNMAKIWTHMDATIGWRQYQYSKYDTERFVFVPLSIILRDQSARHPILSWYVKQTNYPHFREKIIHPKKEEDACVCARVYIFSCEYLWDLTAYAIPIRIIKAKRRRKQQHQIKWA